MYTLQLLFFFFLELSAQSNLTCEQHSFGATNSEVVDSGKFRARIYSKCSLLMFACIHSCRSFVVGDGNRRDAAKDRVNGRKANNY